MKVDWKEQGEFMGLAHLWWIVTLGIAVATTFVVLALRPAFLGFEREAMEESQQYTESHKEKVIGDMVAYDELEAEIAKYEREGAHKIAENLRTQQRAIARRIKATLAKMPPKTHPRGSARFE